MILPDVYYDCKCKRMACMTQLFFPTSPLYVVLLHLDKSIVILQLAGGGGGFLVCY